MGATLAIYQAPVFSTGCIRRSLATRTAAAT